MFELCGSLSITRWGSPLVLPGEIFPRSLVYHRLDCEDMTFFHEAYCFILSVMRDWWCLVENFSNSMSSIRTHNLKAFSLNMVCYNIATFSVHCVWFTVINCFLKWFVSCFDKHLWWLTDFSDKVSFIQVSVEAIIVCSHIKVNDVAFLQWPCIGNSMTDDFINWCTTTSWEAIVIEWRWISSLTGNVFVHNLIDFLCCHARCNCSMTCI